MNTFKIVFLLFLIPVFSVGQEVIYLMNPSFEDMPRHSRQPRGSYDCGYPGETPPDTQPGQFDVTLLPHEGDSYIGMVVRQNETWERISQNVTSELLANQTYSFSIFLARSELYLSPSRADTLLMKNHITPCILRIWGGNGWCTRGELLAETDLIVNTEWEEYKMEFKPSKNYKTIILEAFYKTDADFLYNGNILMDKASPIIPMDSLNGEKIAQPDPNYIKKYTPPISNYSNSKKSQTLRKRYSKSSNPTEKNSKPRTGSSKPMISLNSPRYSGNPNFRKFTNLKTYISARGTDVEFNYKEDDIISDGKKFLNKTVEKIHTLDEPAVLIIAVYDDLDEADKKLEIIKIFMDSTDLDSKDFVVRKIKKSDKLKFWQSDNGIVKIRLIKK